MSDPRGGVRGEAAGAAPGRVGPRFYVESGAVAIAESRTPAHLEAARALFTEYARSLGFDLSFQGFDQEMASLPGDYAAPGGALLIAYIGVAATGCVALRPFESGVCEMKRMYVRPAFRGLGIGRALAARVIDLGRTRGYARMRLDTIATMTEATALYESLGFRPIPAYRHNPLEGARFFEREL